MYGLTIGDLYRPIVVSLRRSLKQITCFCEKLSWPQNSKIALIDADKRDSRIWPHIVTQFAPIETGKSLYDSGIQH